MSFEPWGELRQGQVLTMPEAHPYSFLRRVTPGYNAWPASELAPAEAGFSHRLTAYRIVGHFFGMSYRKISGSNQVKNRFFRINNISVPCLHAQLRGRTVIKKLSTFFGPWGRDRSWSPPCWIFLVKQIHPSTASERTTRQRHSLRSVPRV